MGSIQTPIHSSLVNGRSRQFDAQRVQQLEHGVVAWLGAGRQCLVQAFATHPGILGKLGHASGAGHVAHRSQEDIGVGVFQCGGDVFRDGFLAVELVGGVEGEKFFTGLLLVQ